MNSIFFLKLFKSAREIYHKSENILLEQSLLTLINDENGIEDIFQLLEDIYRQNIESMNNFPNHPTNELKRIIIIYLIQSIIHR